MSSIVLVFLCLCVANTQGFPLLQVANETNDIEEVGEMVPTDGTENFTDVFPVVGITIEEMEQEARRSEELEDDYEYVFNSLGVEENVTLEEVDDVLEIEVVYGSDVPPEQNTPLQLGNDCGEEEPNSDDSPCKERRSMPQDAQLRLKEDIDENGM